MYLLCVVLAVRFWRFPLRAALLSVEIGLFCMWSALLVGWSLIHGSVWDELAKVILVGWLSSAAVALVVMMFPHERHRDFRATRDGQNAESPSL